MQKWNRKSNELKIKDHDKADHMITKFLNKLVDDYSLSDDLKIKDNIIDNLSLLVTITDNSLKITQEQSNHIRNQSTQNSLLKNIISQFDEANDIYMQSMSCESLAKNHKGKDIIYNMRFTMGDNRIAEMSHINNSWQLYLKITDSLYTHPLKAIYQINNFCDELDNEEDEITKAVMLHTQMIVKLYKTLYGSNTVELNNINSIVSDILMNEYDYNLDS